MEIAPRRSDGSPQRWRRILGFGDFFRPRKCTAKQNVTRTLALIAFCLCRAARGSPDVLLFNFKAITVAEPPGLSSLRQPDRSFTAFELGTKSPYPIIRSTPNYAASLDRCLPPRGDQALHWSRRGANFGNTPGATSGRRRSRSFPPATIFPSPRTAAASTWSRSIQSMGRANFPCILRQYSRYSSILSFRIMMAAANRFNKPAAGNRNGAPGPRICAPNPFL
jgi:hypothetical protein